MILVAGSEGMSTPPGYEQKFADFIRLCTQAKASGTKEVIVAFPWVLGDNYEEVMESLSRLADAGLSLTIVTRNDVEPELRLSRLAGESVARYSFGLRQPIGVVSIITSRTNRFA